jgi:adenylate kinase family enzyme
MSGTGKGTIIDRLAAYAGQMAGLNGPIPKVSMRTQLFRPIPELIAMGIPAEDAPTVRARVEAGILLEPHIVIPAMRAALDRPEFCDNWIIDGSPRSAWSIEVLENRANSPTTIIVFTADKDEIRRRARDRFVDDTGESFSAAIHKIDPQDPRHPVTGEMLKRRPDDDTERLEFRFGEYERTIAKTITLYRNMQRPGLRFIDINTTSLTPDEVFETLVAKLYGSA